MSVIKQLIVTAVLASMAASVWAAPVPVPSAVPQAAPQDGEKIKAADDANTAFTPLVMPEEAAGRGISLSGEAKLYQLEPGRYKLGCGCVLVHTEEPISITTCRADITTRAGATIVIGTKKEVTRVLNLSDRKHDSVRIVFGKNHIPLNPGEEIAVVSAGASDVDKAATEYVIRYRNVQEVAVSPDYVALLFEFSLADAMKHCLIFKQLHESPRQEDRKLLDEIIKTAAAVNTVFAKSRSRYAHKEEEAIAAEQFSHPALKKKQLERMRLVLKYPAAAGQSGSP
jgi:hypothetical protein